MTVSLTALQSMFAQQTGEVWLQCLTVAYASLAQPLRFVNDVQPLVRSSGTHIAFPFRIELPQDSESEQVSVQLVLDNVDRQIVQMIRTLTSTPTITLEVVLRSTPNAVEAGPFVFVVKSASYDAMQVTLTLGYEIDLLNMPANKWRITPANCPGTF